MIGHLIFNGRIVYCYEYKIRRRKMSPSKWVVAVGMLSYPFGWVSPFSTKDTRSELYKVSI
jgi:hypothetical protein